VRESVQAASGGTVAGNIGRGILQAHNAVIAYLFRICRRWIAPIV
jgi:hypothetical protein